MNKNIGIIVPTLSMGGAEKVASILSTQMSNEKMNVYLILYNAEEINYSYSGKIINLNTSPTKNVIKKVINFLIRIYKVNKIKKEYNLETVISFLGNPNLVNLFSGKGAKKIVSVRNFVSKSDTGKLGKLKKILIRLFYNFADVVVVVSEEIRKDLIENFKIKSSKIKVIYNAYDVQSIQEKAGINTCINQDVSKSQSEKKNVKPMIVNMGRLVHQKGQIHLIRSLKILKLQGIDVNLMLIGSGPLKEALVQETYKNGLEENVTFIEYSKNPFEYLTNADIFVLSSLYEGFPNALCEAMACKLPIISSNCQSGPYEILSPNIKNDEDNDIFEGEYGILIRLSNNSKVYEENLAQAIKKMILDEEFRKHYSKQSIQRVSEMDIKTFTYKWKYII